MAEWFRALDFNAMTRVQIPLWPLLSISDVRGEGLFFSPLHGPLVSVCRKKTSGHVITFCSSAVCKNLQMQLNTRKADRSRDQYFGNRRAAKNVFTWPEFLNRRMKRTVREVGWKKPLSTDVSGTSEMDSSCCCSGQVQGVEPGTCLVELLGHHCK